MSSSFEIRDQLRAVQRKEGIDRLQLKNQPSLDQDVQPTLANRLALVGQFDHWLSDKRDAAGAKLNAESGFVCRFQETGAESSMHFQCRANDAIGQLVQLPVRFIHLLCGLCVFAAN